MKYDLHGISQPDPTDTATELELLYNADSIDSISKLVPTQPNLVAECEICGLDIEPIQRRELGYKTCVRRQTRHEMLTRRF